MTPAEQVVKALRKRGLVGAAFPRPAGDSVNDEYKALADFVERADSVRWGGDYDTPESWDKVLREFDAALARLAEVLNG